MAKAQYPDINPILTHDVAAAAATDDAFRELGRRPKSPAKPATLEDLPEAVRVHARELREHVGALRSLMDSLERPQANRKELVTKAYRARDASMRAMEAVVDTVGRMILTPEDMTLIGSAFGPGWLTELTKVVERLATQDGVKVTKLGTIKSLVDELCKSTAIHEIPFRINGKRYAMIAMNRLTVELRACDGKGLCDWCFTVGTPAVLVDGAIEPQPANAPINAP